MGKVRTKIIESDLDNEKIEAITELEHPTLENAEKEVSAETKVATPKPVKKGAQRSRGKRYSEALKLIDKSKTYETKEALEIIKKAATAKFDETLEAHINLNLDGEKQDHQIRTTITLPHQVGKKLSILVFAEKNIDEIKKLGAEIGTEKDLKDIEGGKISFDKIISDPSWMPKLARVAKVLGPKGLMPSPKSGTVSDDPLKAVSEFTKGKSEIKTEKNPVIHTIIGKKSFEVTQLEDNLKSLLDIVQSSKPDGFKKEMIRSISLSSAMGPSVRVDLSSLKAS